MSPIGPSIPATIRNRDFLALAIIWFALAAIALLLNVVSGFGLRWFGGALIVVPVLVAAYWLMSWRTAELAIAPEGVRIGRLRTDLVLNWSDIRVFTIRQPRDRTLLMLPWADQARVVLSDGTIHRIRAVRPSHYTQTIWSVMAPTAADAVVDTLNDLRERDLDRRSGTKS